MRAHRAVCLFSLRQNQSNSFSPEYFFLIIILSIRFQNARLLSTNTKHKWIRVELNQQSTDEFQCGGFFSRWFRLWLQAQTRWWLWIIILAPKRAIELVFSSSQSKKKEEILNCIVVPIDYALIYTALLIFSFENDRRNASPINLKLNPTKIHAFKSNLRLINSTAKYVEPLRCIHNLLITSRDDLHWFIDIDPNEKRILFPNLLSGFSSPACKNHLTLVLSSVPIVKRGGRKRACWNGVNKKYENGNFKTNRVYVNCK